MKTTAQEYRTMSQICTRFESILARERMQIPDRLDTMMDIDAAHRDNPIDLDALLAADESNFIHDVMGIRKNINRKTCKLDNCFMPRFAAK